MRSQRVSALVHRRSLRVGLVLLAVLGLLPGSAARPQAVRAVVPPITLEASATKVAAGTEVTLTIRTFNDQTGDPQAGAEFWLDTDIGTSLGSGTTDFNGVATQTYAVPFGAIGIRARWVFHGLTGYVYLIGTGASTTTLTLDSPEPVVEGKPVTFGVSAWNIEANQTANYGTFELHEQGSDVVLGQVTVDGQPGQISLPDGLPAGTRQLVADFGGIGEIVLPSSSDPLEVVVGEDTVADFGPTLNHGTSVYPVKDGYRDTIMTEAAVHEAGTVTIRVRSVATNGIVRSYAPVHVGRFDGSYGISWNGRRADGSIVPSGTYRFEHVFTDDFGNTATLTTASVTVSPRKLVWTTVASATKQGRAYTYYTGGSGWIKPAASSFSGGVRVNTRILGYKLTLATVAIPSSAVVRRVTFSVHGKGISGYGAWLAINNETLGAPNNINAYDVWKQVGSAYTWTSATTSAVGSHLVGRNVYGYVDATRTYDIDDVRATLSYAVLR